MAQDYVFVPGDVTIEPGQTVHFSYPSGGNVHNVKFSAAQPTQCTQTSGAVIGPAPPLPQFALPPGWAGDCTFDSPGVYPFFCQAHPDQMKGTVTVGTPTETPTPTATVTATPTAIASEPPPVRDGTPAPQAKPWASLERPPSPQLAVLLRGKLKLTARCASVNAGAVTLTVSKAVAKKLRLKRTTLASGRSRCDGNNRFTVALRPTAAAKKALARHRGAIKATATLAFPGLTVAKPITLAGSA